MCIPQRRWTFSGPGFSFGLLDRRAKPLLQCRPDGAIVVALLQDGAREQDGPLRRKDDETSSNAGDRIALTGVTVKAPRRVGETPARGP